MVPRLMDRAQCFSLVRDWRLARKTGDHGWLRAAAKFPHAAISKPIGDWIDLLVSLGEGPTCAASSDS